MTDLPRDHDRDAFTAELTARVTSPSNHASLSPAVRSVVTETLDPSASGPPSLAVPIALVRATAAAGDIGDGGSSQSDAPPTAPTRATLLEVSASLAFLGGYARLRRDVLDAARTANRDRDVAILASDYLHAAAHATLAGVSIPTDRHVALYRALTAGSATLAASFLERKGTLESTSCSYSYSESNPYPNAHSNEEGRRHTLERPTPTAVLAGTGSALGAAVAGSSRETLEAMRTYGESLVAAVDVVSGETTNGDGADHDHDHGAPILETVERVLLGHRTGPDATDPSVGSPERPAAVPDSRVPDPETTTAVDAHLERARSALERLPETTPRKRLEAATLVPGTAAETDR